MAVFVPVRKWYKRRQPSGPRVINWAIPLAKGLELAVIAPDRFAPEIAYGRTVNTVTGTMWSGVTEWGEGLDFPAETSKSVSYNAPLLDRPFTCVIGYRLNAIPSTGRNVCGNYISNTSGWRITPDAANFRAQFGRAGAAMLLTGSAIAVGNKIDAVVANATDFFYYENGVQTATGTQSLVAPTNLFALGGNSAPIMTIAFCYLFSRALSAEEIAELYESPYKLLMPDTKIIRLADTSLEHGISGDIVGPGAEMTGELEHHVPGSEAGSFLLGGDIVGPGAEMSGTLTHYNPALVTEHELTGNILGGCVAELGGSLLRSTPYTPPPPPNPSDSFGGFWDLPTGRHRRDRIKSLKQKDSELIEQELEVELNLEKYPDNINKLVEIQDNRAAILEQILAIQAEQDRFKQEFNIKARLLLLN